LLLGVPKRNAEGTPLRVLSSTEATCAPSERRGRGVPILLSMLSENEPPGAAWVLVLVLVATPLDLGEGVAVDVEEEDGSRKLSPGTGKCCSPGWAQSRLADRLGPPERTGYRWRAEVGDLVPVRLAEAVRSNRYLSLLERQRIAALHSQGVHSGDRPQVGTQRLHGQQGAAQEHCPQRSWRVRRTTCSLAGSGPRSAPWPVPPGH
jgi:hypothetical protein